MNHTYLSLFLLIGLAACNGNNQEFDASGVFEADEVIISSESVGKILRFEVEEGTELKAGQVIGSVDCKNLSLQKAQVEASIDALGQKTNDATPQTQIIREQLVLQQRQIATQREQLRILERERKRIENLVKAEAVPAKQLDDVEGQIDVLKKQIEATESQVSVLNQQIKSQQQQVSIQNRGVLSERKPLEERIAQMDDQLQRCSITNPIDGTVLVKYATADEMTTTGKALYKIANLSTLTLRAYITGDQLAKIKLNQPVKVFVDNGKDAYKEVSGTVTWIASKAEFTPKTIQTKDERANLVYATKIKVKNDGYLKIGMYGEVKL
ncbi:HlyD family secretion protein [Runella aurantiaca]|uniref:HlyD family efflux transporter periplasmic adaptor subunit n=1 Tax=Runella aurantiaca TaxID=2282308 RepID=A0A369IGF3_9BACT|nr:HlyD family efflux transporter periplasmic adaptor subunit [Runella aurantiaca]RDB06493.1 HlyD family efflux transporter periplasmic adaptor subunit [Runella aurantiaca]